MDSPSHADFAELIARLARALADQGLPFMLIGGQAVLVHGEPRLTQDVDVTLGASPERLDDALAACEAAGLSPLPRDIATFVRDTFVLPAADPGTGIRVDLVFSTTGRMGEVGETSIRYTYDDLQSIPEDPTGHRYEIVDGRLVVKGVAP